MYFRLQRIQTGLFDAFNSKMKWTYKSTIYCPDVQVFEETWKVQGLKQTEPIGKLWTKVVGDKKSTARFLSNIILTRGFPIFNRWRFRSEYPRINLSCWRTLLAEGKIWDYSNVLTDTVSAACQVYFDSILGKLVLQWHKRVVRS